MRTIDKILTKLDCRYGAPMGRGDVFSSIRSKKLPKVFDCKVELTQGYDKGGAYWVLPNNLRVSYTKDLQLIHFYRK